MQFTGHSGTRQESGILTAEFMWMPKANPGREVPIKNRVPAIRSFAACLQKIWLHLD
jgi:hypothetical protein